MGLSYYTSRGMEPYINPDTGKVDVRAPTSNKDQWSTPTSTPEQAAQMAYVQSHTPAQVQQAQRAAQQARNDRMGISQSEINRQASIRAANAPIAISNGQSIVGSVKMPTGQKSNITPWTLTERQSDEQRMYAAAPTAPMYSAKIVEDFSGASKYLNTNIPSIPDGIANIPVLGSVAWGVRDLAVGLPMAVPQIVGTFEYAARATSRTQAGNPDEFIYYNLKIGSENAIQSLKTDPVRFLTPIILPMAIGGAAAKGGGVLRTIGKSELKIENYGYEPSKGYPKNPTPTSAKNVLASFKGNTLVPVPKEMSTGLDVPYVPTQARLPGTVLKGNERVILTGWEQPPPAKVGQTYVMPAAETSETSGMYAAPVAELYFTHISTPMSEAIGFGSPLKRPTAVYTIVHGVEAVPKGLRTKLGSKNFIEQQSKPGVAYADLYKGEYQAILASGQEVKVTASNYYFKVGGFGKSRLFGTRIPLVEQRTTGVFQAIPKVNKIQYAMPEKYSYKPQPLIDLTYAPVGLSAYSGGMTKVPSYRSAVSSASYPSTTKVPSYRSVASSSYSPSRASPSYSSRSSTAPSSGSSSSGSSGGSSGGSSSRPPYTPPSYTPPSYTPPYSPPPYKPPYYPSTTRRPPISRSYLPLSYAKTPKGSSHRGRGYSTWTGAGIINKVVTLKQAFGTRAKKWRLI
jgi:hypothetical protein